MRAAEGVGRSFDGLPPICGGRKSVRIEIGGGTEILEQIFFQPDEIGVDAGAEAEELSAGDRQVLIRLTGFRDF